MARYKKYNQNIYITNATPPKSLFAEREKFNKMYPKGFGYPEPIDFYTEKDRLYGVLDQKKNILVPNEDFLVNIGGTPEREIFVFDFVADAFRDFLHYMNGKNKQKLIDDDNKLKKPFKAHKGWEDVGAIQEKADEANFKAFVTIYLKSHNKHKKIKDFADFVELYLNGYVENMIKEVPLTNQGMILSNIVSPMASGLCIEISSKDKSNLYDMFNTYINNRNYKTYLMTAATYGFMVDKHVPYRLVANLGSPKMLAYIEARQDALLNTPRNSTTGWSTQPFRPSGKEQTRHTHIYNVDKFGNGWTSTLKSPLAPPHRHQIKNFVVQSAQAWEYPDGVPTGVPPHEHDLARSDNPVPWNMNSFFDLYYVDSAARDVLLLRDRLKRYYNQYIEKFPIVKDTVPCGSSRSKEIIIKRSPIGPIQYDEQYEMLFFLKLFYLIRLRELEVDVEPDAIRANVKKIETLYNLVDMEQALGYITDYLKQFY
jgi:hypothetical protein